jgi:hypothetical protein
MKNRIGLVLVITVSMVGCQSSDKEVKDANERLKQANTELEVAKFNKDKAEQAKAIAEWDAFKKESDSLIGLAATDLENMQEKLKQAGKKDAEKVQADYEKAKKNLALLQERLRQRNTAFKDDLKKLDHQVYEKNESFKREFKHDMDELQTALKDLFKDNVQ